MFVLKENRKSFPLERWIELWIDGLFLFGLDPFGVRWGAIFSTKFSLSSLFLLLLAGQFFSPLFALIRPGMFWQDTPLLLSKNNIMSKQ